MVDPAVKALKQILATRRKKFLQYPSLVPAAVLLLFYPKNGEYCILLNKRSEEVEHHKGEISFPGGSCDPEDHTPLHTALREAYEEMGIRPEDVTILGELDEVDTRTRFGVQAFVGTIPYPYPFSPNTREIAEVLEVPVHHLLEPSNRLDEVRWIEGKTFKTNVYLYGEHLIFGATARMCGHFIELLTEVSLSVRAST